MLRILLLSICSYCVIQFSFAADKIRLVTDWFINPNHAAIIVAKQGEIFNKYGLDVTITEPSDPSIPSKLVAAGKADLAISYQPQLYLQVNEGLPISRISTLISTPLNTILVREDSSIKKIADLRGKSIGYSVPGVDEAMLVPVLATGGLTLDDVKLINVNWSLLPSLMSKQVDAIIGGMRTFEVLEMRKQNVPTRAFFLEENGIPAYDELIIIANNKERSSEKYVRFNAALEEATQYILNHPEDAWKQYISYPKTQDDDLSRAVWQETLPRLTLRPGALDHRRYQRYGEFMQSIGLIPQLPTLDSYAIEP